MILILRIYYCLFETNSSIKYLQSKTLIKPQPYAAPLHTSLRKGESSPKYFETT